MGITEVSRQKKKRSSYMFIYYPHLHENINKNPTTPVAHTPRSWPQWMTIVEAGCINITINVLYPLVLGVDFYSTTTSTANATKTTSFSPWDSCSQNDLEQPTK